MAPLAEGKVPPDLLREILGSLEQDSSVILGPSVGRDAAVVKPPDGSYMVLTADPITFASERLPLYCLAVNANDIYVMGGEPRFFLATVLLPAGTDAEAVRQLFRDLGEAASRSGVSVVGGHTEVVAGLSSTIISGHMVGFAAPDRLVRNERAEPGDVLLLCGPVAVEGTAIMAQDAPEDCERILGREGRERAAGFLSDPGISVGPLARILFEIVVPRACHDPTDGGLLAAVAELAESSGCGASIERDRVPVLEECRLLCDAFGLDPLRLIASGSLLAAVSASEADRVCAEFSRRGVSAAPIGELRPKQEGLTLKEENRSSPFPDSFRDEIVRFLGKVEKTKKA